MKNVKKIVVLFVLLVLSFSLFACDKDKDKKIKFSDVYVNHTSAKEITSYKQEIVLPVGWSVCTSLSDSDVGYIKELDAFVITNGEVRSLWKCGAKSMMFPDFIAIDTIRYKNGLICTKFTNGEVAVFNKNGKTIISRKKIQNLSSSISLKTCVKILDNGLIAVKSAYSYASRVDGDGNQVFYKAGINGYTSIYRPTETGDVSNRGSLVCLVKNLSNSLDKVDGFDGKYVSVTYDSENNESVSRIFNIPSKASYPIKKIDGTANGTIFENDYSNYYQEITYLGKDKFLIHEDWTVNKEDSYTYFDGKEYRNVRRHFYYPATDKLESYKSNKIFLNLTNKYYGVDKGKIYAKSFLKEEYLYASYGLYIDGDKIAYYDQYILDSDLNVVLSLTGNLNITTKKQEIDDISFFDLIISFKDDFGYAPILPSVIKAYDTNGKIKFSNKDNRMVLSTEYNNGMLIVNIQDPEDKENNLFGAYDKSGKKVVEFKYDKLSMFRGYYTVGEREEDNDDKIVIVGKDGKEVSKMSDGSKPLADIASTNSGSPIYKNGCYMFKTTIKDKDQKDVDYYGIKNFNVDTSKNIVMEAKMQRGSIMYAPSTSPNDVFVFAKSVANDQSVTYTVYRLI